jgi:hypothetical protein
MIRADTNKTTISAEIAALSVGGIRRSSRPKTIGATMIISSPKMAPKRMKKIMERSLLRDVATVA